MPVMLPTDIVWADVLGIAPELSTISDAGRVPILWYVNQMTNAGVDPGGGLASPTLRLARIFLAAHYGTVSKRGGGPAGPVTSESAGGLRRSYGLIAAPTGTYGLGSTTYGLAYLSVLSMSDAHGPIVL